MKTYAKINSKVWITHMRPLRGNPRAQLLYAYLRSCHHATCCGIYFVPPSFIVEELGLSIPEVETGISTLQSYGLVRYDTDTHYVWVLNACEDSYGDGAISNRSRLSLCSELRANLSHPFVGLFVKEWAEVYGLRVDANLARLVGPVAPPTPNHSIDSSISDSKDNSPKLTTGNNDRHTKEQVTEVWNNWLELHQQSGRAGPRPVLDLKRQRLIKALLKDGFDVASLKLAAVGIWTAPWYKENNQVRFDLCYRDAAHVEQLMAKAAPTIGAPVPARNYLLQDNGWIYTPTTDMWNHPKMNTGWCTEAEAETTQVQIDSSRVTRLQQETEAVGGYEPEGVSG